MHSRLLETELAEPDENVGYRFSKNKLNRIDLKIQKPKTQFAQFGFQTTNFSGLWTVFHDVSFTNMIGSTVKVFFFMPYLCTFSSESIRLTISWTNTIEA